MNDVFLGVMNYIIYIIYGKLHIEKKGNFSLKKEEEERNL